MLRSAFHFRAIVHRPTPVKKRLLRRSNRPEPLAFAMLIPWHGLRKTERESMKSERVWTTVREEVGEIDISILVERERERARAIEENVRAKCIQVNHSIAADFLHQRGQRLDPEALLLDSFVGDSVRHVAESAALNIIVQRKRNLVLPAHLRDLLPAVPVALDGDVCVDTDAEA